jgi:hypothetical protein
MWLTHRMLRLGDLDLAQGGVAVTVPDGHQALEGAGEHEAWLARASLVVHVSGAPHHPFVSLRADGSDTLEIDPVEDAEVTVLPLHDTYSGPALLFERQQEADIGEELIMQPFRLTDIPELEGTALIRRDQDAMAACEPLPPFHPVESHAVDARDRGRLVCGEETGAFLSRVSVRRR